MSLTITRCKHVVMEIEGEQVCRKCAMVIGYSETESVSDWTSHSIGSFAASNLYAIISKLGKNLHLPSYALQTIVQVSSRISKMQVSKKQAILFATVYSCRAHNIPRLLEDICIELENATGGNIRHSEKSLLHLLNRISKRVEGAGLIISPPNKDYYLQAYLAKIQHMVRKEVDQRYFEILRMRSLRTITHLSGDPSVAAKNAILENTSRILRTKVKAILN